MVHAHPQKFIFPYSQFYKLKQQNNSQNQLFSHKEVFSDQKMNLSATTVKGELVHRLKLSISYTCVVFQTPWNIFKREKVKKQLSIIGILILILRNLNALPVLSIFNWISYGKIIIVRPDFFSNSYVYFHYLFVTFFGGWDVLYRHFTCSNFVSPKHLKS